MAALHGTWKLARMITTAIDLSRLECGKLPINPVPLNVRILLDEAIAQVANPLEKRVFSLPVAEGLPNLRADQDLAVRMAVNLLSNAVKFSPPQAPVLVEARREDDGQVRLSFTDCGPGVPPEFRDSLFQKFAVGALHALHPSPSSGMGLAFCKLAAEAQGGRVGYESESGRGSTFWFSLPADSSR